MTMSTAGTLTDEEVDMYEEVRYNEDSTTTDSFELSFDKDSYESSFEELWVEFVNIRDNYDLYMKKSNKSALRRARSSARALVKMLKQFLAQTKPSKLEEVSE